MRLDRVKLISEMARREIKVKELAQKTAVAASTISGIRSGKSCTAAIGNAIANALCVDVKDLLED